MPTNDGNTGRYDDVWRASEPICAHARTTCTSRCRLRLRASFSKLHPEADQDIVLLALLLHDIGWWSIDMHDIIEKGFGPNMMQSDVRFLHEKEGVRLSREVLQKTGWPQTVIEAVAEIIDGHDTRPQARSLNDRLVRDADKLWRFTVTGVAVACDWFKMTPHAYADRLEKQVAMLGDRGRTGDGRARARPHPRRADAAPDLIRDRAWTCSSTAAGDRLHRAPATMSSIPQPALLSTPCPPAAKRCGHCDRGRRARFQDVAQNADRDTCALAEKGRKPDAGARARAGPHAHIRTRPPARRGSHRNRTIRRSHGCLRGGRSSHPCGDAAHRDARRKGDRDARTGRRRDCDYAVQLSGDLADLQARRRADRRLHGCRQAGRGYAAVDADAGRLVSRSRLSGRMLQRRDRQGRASAWP